MDPASLITSGTSGLVTIFFLTIGVDSASLYPQCLQALAAAGGLAGLNTHRTVRVASRIRGKQFIPIIGIQDQVAKFSIATFRQFKARPVCGLAALVHLDPALPHIRAISACCDFVRH